jgi:hypothetical protein
MAIRIWNGAALPLVSRAGGTIQTVTVLSASIHTIRYRDQTGATRSLPQNKFLRLARLAVGEEPPPRGRRRPPPMRSIPIGGQPGFKRR